MTEPSGVERLRELYAEAMELNGDLHNEPPHERRISQAIIAFADELFPIISSLESREAAMEGLAERLDAWIVEACEAGEKCETSQGIARYLGEVQAFEKVRDALTAWEKA